MKNKLDTCLEMKLPAPVRGCAVRAGGWGCPGQDLGGAIRA